MSDSVRPHRRQPTRVPHSWDSPGKNTGVGCHFLLQCIKVKSESEVKLLSHVQLLVTPWTAAYQAPPSKGFSRQEYWSGLPFPSSREFIETPKTKQTKSPSSFSYKSAMDLNRHFSRDIQVAHNHMNRCLILLIIRKIQTKIMKRHPLTPIRMTTIKKITKKQ